MALSSGTSKAVLSKLLESEKLLRLLCRLPGSDTGLVQLSSLERCHLLHWVEWHEGEITELRQLAWTVHHYDITLLQEGLWKERMQDITSLEVLTTSFWHSLKQAHAPGNQSGSSDTGSGDSNLQRWTARYCPWKSRSR